MFTKGGVPAVMHLGSVASWEHWDAGWSPNPVQWVKDRSGVLQLGLRSQLWLGSDSWPRNLLCCGKAKKKKKKKKVYKAIIKSPTNSSYSS